MSTELLRESASSQVFKIGFRVRSLRSLLVFLTCLVPALVPAQQGAARERVALETLFSRLESLGADTQTVRAVADAVPVFFRAPDQDRQAHFDYVSRRLFIPFEMGLPGASSLRPDLGNTDLGILVHEFQHAYDVLFASPAAAPGSDERETWLVRRQLVRDLSAGRQAAGSGCPASDADAKALEISGYFMGDAVSALSATVSRLMLYNNGVEGRFVPPRGESDRASDRLVIPDMDTGNSLVFDLLRSPFWQLDMSHTARYRGGVVRWPENRPEVRQLLYRHGLGLHLPESLAELARRLSTSDNPLVVSARRRAWQSRRLSEYALPGRWRSRR